MSNLKQVVALAKNGQTTEALTLLKQYIRQNPSDPNGWWAMANLAPTDKIKIESLKRVLKLKPEHGKARQMLASLERPPEPPKREGPEWLTAEVQTPSVEPPPADDDFPPMHMFGMDEQSASQSATSDAEQAIIQNVLRRKQEQRQAAAASQKKEVGLKTWVWILGGVFSIAAVVAIVLIIRLFFWDNDPDLNASIGSVYASMDYPKEWVADVTDTNMIVVSTQEIRTRNINPWADLTDTAYRDYSSYIFGKLEYWQKYYGSYDLVYADSQEEMGAELSAAMGEMMSGMIFGGFGGGPEEIEEDDLIVALLQPVPYRSTRDYTPTELVDYMIELFEEDMEYSFAGISQKLNVTQENITIGGQPATFFRATAVGGYTGVFGNDEENFSTLYLATTSYGDIDFLFLFTALESKEGRWENLAREMAESIQFNDV